jgi:hypothetical protein
MLIDPEKVIEEIQKLIDKGFTFYFTYEKILKRENKSFSAVKSCYYRYAPKSKHHFHETQTLTEKRANPTLYNLVCIFVKSLKHFFSEHSIKSYQMVNYDESRLVIRNDGKFY